MTESDYLVILVAFRHYVNVIVDRYRAFLVHFVGLYHRNPKRQRGTFPRTSSLTLRVTTPSQPVQVEETESTGILQARLQLELPSSESPIQYGTF